MTGSVRLRAAARALTLVHAVLQRVSLSESEATIPNAPESIRGRGFVFARAGG